MILVLAGSQRDYDRFREALWRRDKDTSQYRYVGNYRDLLGNPRDAEIIKLGSFRNHRDTHEIEACLRRSGMEIRSRRPRPSFGAGGTTFTRAGDSMSVAANGRVDLPLGIEYVPLPRENYAWFEHTATAAEGAVLTRQTLEDARDQIVRNSGMPETGLGRQLARSHAERIDREMMQSVGISSDDLEDSTGRYYRDMIRENNRLTIMISTPPVPVMRGLSTDYAIMDDWGYEDEQTEET